MPGHDYVFNVMGMGSDPDKLDLGSGPLAALFTGLFTESIGYLAHRLGVQLDGIEADHEVMTTPVDIQAAAGLVPAGTVAANQLALAWHGGREALFYAFDQLDHG